MVVAVSPPVRGPRRRRAAPVRGPALSACRELVVVDGAAIRRKAVKDCSRARTTFQKAEKELADYEAVDVPAYVRWYRNTFGPDLQRIRDVLDKAEALSRDLDRLERYANFAGVPPRKAVEFLETDPAGFAEAERQQEEKFRQEQEEFQRREDAKREAFVVQCLKSLKTFLRENRQEIKGLKRQNLSPVMVLQMVMEEFAEVMGLFDEDVWMLLHDDRVRALLREHKLLPDLGHMGGEEETSRRQEEHGGSDRGRNRKSGKLHRPGEEAGSNDARLKALKRELAFSLHPDQDGKDSPQRLELWHQVQEAVAAGDVDRLEVIQAHLHMLSGELSEKTPVSRLHALTAMYRESRDALRRRIRKLRKEPAWGFSTQGEREREVLRREVLREIQDQRRRAESALRSVRAELEEFKNEEDDFLEEGLSIWDLFEK